MFRMWLLILFGLTLVALATTFFSSQSVESNLERIEQLAEDTLARAEELTSSQDTTPPPPAEEATTASPKPWIRWSIAGLPMILLPTGPMSCRQDCNRL